MSLTILINVVSQSKQCRLITLKRHLDIGLVKIKSLMLPIIVIAHYLLVLVYINFNR